MIIHQPALSHHGTHGTTHMLRKAKNAEEERKAKRAKKAEEPKEPKEPKQAAVATSKVTAEEDDADICWRDPGDEDADTYVSQEDDRDDKDDKDNGYVCYRGFTHLPKE